MRFRKIKEIMDSDAFDSFDWKGPDFRRYNLIYGWNGSGKTTTSRIFRSIECGAVATELGATQFQVVTEDGIMRNVDITAPSNGVRVFNDDFVKENLEFHESKTKQILIVGNASIEAEGKIRSLEERRKEAGIERKVLEESLGKIKPLDKIRKAASDEVVKQFANTPLGTSDYSGRKYNRKEVDDLLAKNIITEANVKSLVINKQEDIDRRREVIKSQRQKVPVFPETVEDFSQVFADANLLLQASPAAEKIDELSNDDERRLWVEDGYALHTARGSHGCLFCGKTLDGGFLERLARFFTKEMDEVKKNVDVAIALLDTSPMRGETSQPDAGLLLPDLSIEYLSFKAEADRYAVEIRAAIGKMTQALKDKRQNVQAVAPGLKIVEYPSKAITGFNEVIAKMVATIHKHNEQIDKKIEAAKEIELHIVAKTLVEKDYFSTKAEHDSLTTKIGGLTTEIDEIERKVAGLKSAILDSAIAIGKINGMLEEFFGRGHICLEPATGTDLGYVLKRRGKNARNLSEGEKNAVALAFFLTKLDEGDFSKKDGSVVVDDPVDSQDELFLFRAFSLI
ncbi:MAG: AAA family ATPase, partial [Candidatus Pacebacteria bacterium]|nr:AAA family ATPase [Candidatus Paceibacterota bacterium]